MGIICSPRCKYWIWLHYKSEDDHSEICDNKERTSPINGKSYPVTEGKYCECGVSI